MFQFSQTLVEASTQSQLHTLYSSYALNTPKVTVTAGNEEDHKKSTSRRGSCVTRQEAHELDDADEQLKHREPRDSNNTSETVIN